MSFQCSVTHDGKHCENDEQGDAVYLGFLTFCAPHQSAFEDVVLERGLLTEISAARYHRSDLGKSMAEARRNPRPMEPAPTLRDMRYEATVYFFRCGRYIKIGYSIDPLKRLRAIRAGDGTRAPDEIDSALAVLVQTEPGGFGRERDLHAKFSHLRHTGEWFTEAPELTQYIESLSEAAA
jgi:hypothetical protein